MVGRKALAGTGSAERVWPGRPGAAGVVRPVGACLVGRGRWGCGRSGATGPAWENGGIYQRVVAQGKPRRYARTSSKRSGGIDP